MARFARQLKFINIFQAWLSLNSIMIFHISRLNSFQILNLSSYANTCMLMLSTPLIVTDTTVALYMQAYELIGSV